MASCWKGSCSCGATRFSLHSPGSDEWVERVICPCSFCRRTGAWYVVDRFGRVELEPSAITRSAEIAGGPGRELLCRSCGDYIGTVWTKPDGPRIALNGRLLDTGSFVFPTCEALVHGDAPATGPDQIEFPKLTKSP